MTTYYKALSADGRSCNGGNSKWSLPVLKPDGTYKPGRWMPTVNDIVPCERGYHVFERKDILHWINATLYEAEGRDARIDHDGDKVVFASVRLLRPVPGCNERTLRLFACRVAEDVLPLFECQYPDDGRIRKAIDTARRYAHGEATEGELAAARDAAWAALAALAAWAALAALAAWAAAWDAWAAVWDAWDAARAAAWAAARDALAAWDAAWAALAARDAAWDDAWANYTDWLWDEFMDGEEPCKPEDVEDTWAKPIDGDRFELQERPEHQEDEPDPYPILVWRPM